MHPEWATSLRGWLALHISCGVVAFLCAPVALATAKGGKVHRRWGKVYFRGYGRRCVHGTDFVIRPAGLLSRYGCGVQILLGIRSVSRSLLEGHVQGRATKGSGLADRDGDGAVESAAVPLGFSAARVDGSGSDPDGGTRGEHCFHRVRDYRNAHGARFNLWLSQAIGRKDVLVVWSYAGNDRQLHRGNDRFFRGESVALVRRGLVGVVVADDHRCPGDCDLDGVLQEEVFP